MTSSGVWGPPTSSVDWCETNYDWSQYVAEMFNTLSRCGSHGIATRRSGGLAAYLAFAGFPHRLCLPSCPCLDSVCFHSFAMLFVGTIGAVHHRWAETRFMSVLARTLMHKPWPVSPTALHRCNSSSHCTLRSRLYRLAFASIAVVGAGSIAFHATLLVRRGLLSSKYGSHGAVALVAPRLPLVAGGLPFAHRPGFALE